MDPCLKAAQDGSHALIAILQQDKRRTGACVFLESGTVGDDPLIFIEIQICGIRFKVS